MSSSVPVLCFFCGLVFRATDVVWPFRLFYYVLPLKWTFNAAGYDVYMPSASYKGAELCDVGANVTLASGAEVACPAAGVYCDGAKCGKLLAGDAEVFTDGTRDFCASCKGSKRGLRRALARDRFADAVLADMSN